MKKELNKINFKLEFDWHLTDLCNFNCEYCHPQIRLFKNRPLPYKFSLEKVVNVFNKLDSPSHILMSGGEPFLYPNFIELCRELTMKNYITINTNFSTHDVVEFANIINPSHVVNIDAALHILERERLNLPLSDFVSKVLFFQKKGFNIHVIYVLYPPLIKRCEKDVRKLRKYGIDKIYIKPYKGIYRGRLYPEGYSDREKKKILSIKNDYPYIRDYLTRKLCFRGEKCKAGYKSFKIEVDGSVFRCMTVKKYYGNLFKGNLKIEKKPLPCPANRVLSLAWCYRFLV